MARGKKAVKELSPEEKLQQALVPVKEQPYSIPENWCWTRLKALVKASKDKTDDFSSGDIKYVGLEHIERDGGIIGYSSATEVKSLKTIFHVGQILYGKLRPYLNKHDIAGFEGVCSTDILVFDTRSCSDSRYVNYFFNQRYFIEYAVSNSKGINLPRVSESIVLEAICPLPPLPEQQRIVTRIESLFAKLDEAKEKAQAVVDGFELRKSAILHKAFTGELTKRWRKEHGMELDSWKKCLIGEVFDLQAGKNISAKKISSQQTDLYRYPCFGGNGIRGYVEQFNREGEHPIIGRQGALCGNINLANDQFYATEHAVVVSYKMDVSTSWAYHYLKFLNLNQYATATAQPGLAVSNIVKVPIQYVPFEEQQELSRILDYLLDKEQQAKSAAEAVLDQIDTMKKAILARVFRGELGTNDPAEESAVKLLLG